MDADIALQTTPVRSAGAMSNRAASSPLAGLVRRVRFLRHRRTPAALLHGLTEEELDLAVDTAQFVSRQRLDLRPEFRVDAEQKRFAIFG